MTGKTHMAVGLAVSLSVLQPKNIKDVISISAVSIIGALAADVDIKTSKAGKFTKKISNYIMALLMIFILVIAADKLLNIGVNNTLFNKVGTDKVFFIVMGALAILYFMIKVIQSSHRGFTHSFTALALSAAAASLFLNTLQAVAFTLSYLSHILIDLLNKKGCQLFYPLSSRYCFKVCKSNGIINDILFWVSCIISAFFVVYGINLFYLPI